MFKVKIVFVVLAGILISILVGCVGGCSLLGLVITKGETLKPALEKLCPRMTYEEVKRIVPQKLIYKDIHQADLVPSSTKVIDGGKTIVSEMYLAAPSPGATTLVQLLCSSEVTWLYFDRSNQLVGIHYSSSAGYWEPSWGKPYQK